MPSSKTKIFGNCMKRKPTFCASLMQQNYFFSF